MKISLSLLIIGFLLLVACSPQASSPPDNEEPTPSTTTEPEPQLVEVLLSYEVVDSYIETETHLERHTLIINDEVIEEEVVEVTTPIGCVALRNTDDEAGTFEVTFHFSTWDWGVVLYDGSQTLELQPGETGVAQYHAIDIEIKSGEDDFSWEFEVTPSTKLIEQ